VARHCLICLSVSFVLDGYGVFVIESPPSEVNHHPACSVCFWSKGLYM
ncbi:hypothetical protein ISN45_At01g043750, partial [Arabidopsis thaliana x Arabidopsis arenosa]